MEGRGLATEQNEEGKAVRRLGLRVLTDVSRLKLCIFFPFFPQTPAVSWPCLLFRRFPSHMTASHSPRVINWGVAPSAVMDEWTTQSFLSPDKLAHPPAVSE